MKNGKLIDKKSYILSHWKRRLNDGEIEEGITVSTTEIKRNAAGEPIFDEMGEVMIDNKGLAQITQPDLVKALIVTLGLSEAVIDIEEDVVNEQGK